MRIRITLEIDDKARTGIHGGKRKATRAEVESEISAVWQSHCDDLRSQVPNHGEDA